MFARDVDVRVCVMRSALGKCVYVHRAVAQFPGMYVRIRAMHFKLSTHIGSRYLTN
jgi:hypothetical protein